MPSLHYEVFDDIAAHATRILQDEGLPLRQAKAMGLRIAGALRENWGGQQIYFPMGKSENIEQRNQNLYLRFTGDNQHELATEFKLSLQAVYRILKEQSRLAALGKSVDSKA